MEDLFAWLDQHHLQHLLVWFEEECQGKPSPQDLEVFSQSLDLRYMHGQASWNDVWDHVLAQIEHRATLYDQYVAASPRSRPHTLSLGEVAREALTEAFVQSPGGPSYEEARALLDRVSRQWVRLHTTNPTLGRQHEPPSVAHIQLVFRLVQAYAEAALALPGVQEVVAFLRSLVQNRAIPTEHRKAAQQLLQVLFGQLVPSLRKVPAMEPTMYAAYLRYSMLVDYERELARLQEIMQSTRRNPANRLLTLQERYPTIPRQTLERWRPNRCEQSALELVSLHNGVATHTIRKALTQERQERQQRQHASSSPDTTS